MKKFKPQQKQKIYNVYLHKHKQELEETRKKYKVSISTIARIIVETLAFDKNNNLTIKQIKKLYECYFTTDKLLNHSTIKPRIKNDFIDQLETNQKQILFTNALYHYATKYKHLELAEEQRQKLYNATNNNLNKEKETFWDLNNQIRTQKRAMKIIGATK